jgi:adenylate cyclase
MPGVEIQAHMLHTLLVRRVLLPPDPTLNLALLAGACLASALLSLWLRPLWAAAATFALIVLLVLASYEAYTRGGYGLDFVGPVVAMHAHLAWSRQLARRRLRRAFGQYVSPEVMQRVLREGTDLGGEVRTVSVLMSDVRGFTTLSERMSPGEITATMNEYFTAMVEEVLTRRGMVNDFIGDGLLAVFGAPVDDPEHAARGIDGARDAGGGGPPQPRLAGARRRHPRHRHRREHRRGVRRQHGLPEEEEVHGDGGPREHGGPHGGLES